MQPAPTVKVLSNKVGAVSNEAALYLLKRFIDLREKGVPIKLMYIIRDFRERYHPGVTGKALKAAYLQRQTGPLRFLGGLQELDLPGLRDRLEKFQQALESPSGSANQQKSELKLGSNLDPNGAARGALLLSIDSGTAIVDGAGSRFLRAYVNGASKEELKAIIDMKTDRGLKAYLDTCVGIIGRKAKKETARLLKELRYRDELILTPEELEKLSTPEGIVSFMRTFLTASRERPHVMSPLERRIVRQYIVDGSPASIAEKTGLSEREVREIADRGSRKLVGWVERNLDKPIEATFALQEIVGNEAALRAQRV